MAMSLSFVYFDIKLTFHYTCLKHLPLCYLAAVSLVHMVVGGFCVDCCSFSVVNMSDNLVGLVWLFTFEWFGTHASEALSNSTAIFGAPLVILKGNECM